MSFMFIVPCRLPGLFVANDPSIHSARRVSASRRSDLCTTHSRTGSTSRFCTESRVIASMDVEPEYSSRRRFVGAVLLSALLTANSIAEKEAQARPTFVFTKTDSGLEYFDFEVGKGQPVQEGDVVKILCSGRFLNYEGKTIMKNESYTFKVGSSEVVRGVNEALKSMRRGGIRRIVLPASLGYADRAEQPGPRSFGGQRLVDYVLSNPRVDSTVVFDMEVEEVRKS
mmetsp:Transcript_23933/g.39349  ORF Transcript_23933/g.39349 Transcript_23933/m.39349 type:complete len:227 (-) Transcript_23933:50-730(-)